MHPVFASQSPTWDEGGEHLLTLAPILALAFVLAYLGLVLRAVLQDGRYRALRALGTEERAELAASIASLERRTDAEVVVVVLERSDRHPGAPWFAALVTLLVGSAALMPWLPFERPALLLAAQALLGGLGAGLARWLPGLRRLFVPEDRATEVAEEQALQEFHRHGLHRTARGTGVLLFVSLFERRVVVLGDERVDAVLEREDWARVDAAVLEGVRAGSLRRGLEQALERMAPVLEEHFPARGENPDELPDHVIVRSE